MGERSPGRPTPTFRINHLAPGTDLEVVEDGATRELNVWRYGIVLWAVLWTCACGTSERRYCGGELPGSGVIEDSATVEGFEFIVVDGWAYRNVDGCWVEEVQIYDPSFFEDNYVEEGGVLYKVDPDTQQKFPVTQTFADPFEVGDHARDLIVSDLSRYTTFTLQSPQYPEPSDYNALRNCILDGSCDFADNRIDFDTSRVAEGTKSLRFYSVDATEDVPTCKSSVARELMHYVEGDDVWWQGWFYVDGALPTTLLDLESTWFYGHSGIRIHLSGNLLKYELKWLDKPKYRQVAGQEIPFPTGQWVHLRSHLTLAADDTGQIELWQDGAKIIDTAGKTLPLPNAIYDKIEIGISATQSETTVYVDDFLITDTPIP